MSILFSALLTVCMLAGVYERYAPFASAIGKRQRKWLPIWYSGITLVNFVLLAAAMWIPPGMTRPLPSTYCCL